MDSLILLVQEMYTIAGSLPRAISFSPKGTARISILLDNNKVKDTVGHLEKREKWGIGTEQLWKPSLVQRQSLRFSY